MGRMERPIFLLRRQRRGIVDSQVPSAFQAVEPQRYLVGMLPRGGNTAEICIIRVPIRHGYTFTVYDFIIWRAFVQREPQPQRQDLPVRIEGRDNVYPFRHVCITSILLYKRMFEKSTVKIVILPLMMILIRSASELLRETEHQNATYMYIIKMETLRPWHLREKISSMIGIPVLLRPGQTFGPSE